jgi:hypothetical protein
MAIRDITFIRIVVAIENVAGSRVLIYKCDSDRCGYWRYINFIQV